MSNIRGFRFVVAFSCCLLVFFGVLFTPPVQSLDVRFSQTLVKVAREVVVFCGGHAFRDGAILRAPGGFAVEMRDGCNAINVTILLWSAVLSFPAPWKTKVLGLITGSVIVQVLNIIRFISLFYLGQYSSTWFDFAHAYLWESLLVFDTMVIFWLWVTRVAQKSRAVVTASHAGA